MPVRGKNNDERPLKSTKRRSQCYSEAMFRAVLLVVLAACSLEPIDFAGRPCPCGPGWVCTSNTDEGLCVDEGPPARDCSAYPDALVCDDFEAGISRAWDMNSEGMVSEEAARSGMRSVQFETRRDAPGTVRRLVIDPFTIRSPLYIQAQIRVDAFDRGDDAPAIFQVVWGRGRRIDLLLEGLDRLTAFTSEAMMTSGGGFTLGEWACVRIELLPDAAGSSLRFYVNNIAMGFALDVPEISPEASGQLFVGPGFANRASEIVVFYDDIVVSQQPINCGP